MALTPEVIKANEALTGLTDDQVAAITTLSTNDEQTVVNTKIGEHHGLIEADVLDVTGVAKKEGEKSYDYMKRVLLEFKTSAGSTQTLQSEIDGYKTTIADLEKKILDGSGDAVTIQKLRDTESKLNVLQTAYDTDKQTWEQEKTGLASQISTIQVSHEFGKAMAGIKFKAEYPESIAKTLVSSAQDGILATLKPDFIESEGKKVMVFRDDKGEIVRNKANGLQPFTAKELISERLKDVIDLGKKQPGTGTKNPDGKPDAVDIVDVATAKTQVEADEIISKYLLQQGEMRGTATFAEKQKDIRAKNGVDKLPMR